jgi:hypothetical protein
MPIGFPLLTVHATDRDENSLVKYSLITANSSLPGQIAIDPDTGTIVLRSALSKGGEHHLIVTADDGLFKANATVQLIVEDNEAVNPAHATRYMQQLYKLISLRSINRRPSFEKANYTFRVHEGAPLSFVGHVQATDPDGIIDRFFIEPSEFAELFTVDQSVSFTVLC